MKNKFFTIIILSFITFVAVLPSVSLAASNSYNFTMSYRVVDGSENGKFMTLSKGTAEILGQHKIISSLPKPPPPYTLNYQLYNKTSGNSFGIVKSTPSSTLRSFSGTYSGLGGGTSYYLFIWKTEIDGHTIQGKGDVFN